MQQRLGHYLIKRELGRGGMGTVYQAEDERSGILVAVKILPPELARELQFFNRFRREIRTLAELDHPGIVKVLDVSGGWAGPPPAGEKASLSAREPVGPIYYVMEYVDGPSLQALLESKEPGSGRAKRLDPLKACELGIELCEALEHAHSRGIIHRDIKPANILLDSAGHVHLSDFGIAKMVEATRMTVTGGIVGTAEYMSPEQAQGRNVDRRSDLYSLGVVLYRALTGRVPFEGETVVDLIRQHRYAMLESPKELNPEIPSQLSALIEQLLEKDPDRRPPSAALAKRALLAAHRMLEAGGGELAEILFQRTEQRQAEAAAADRLRPPYVRAAAWLVVAVGLIALTVWQTRPPSASRLLKRGERSIEAGYWQDGLVHFDELIERYPESDEATTASPLREEARREAYERGKDISALVQSVSRFLAREVIARADVPALDPNVTAGEIALARAIRDKIRGRPDDARRKFEAVAVLFRDDEPMIAASALRQVEEMAHDLKTGAESQPTSQPTTMPTSRPVAPPTTSPVGVTRAD